MSEVSPIIGRTEVRKLKDLKPWANNPPDITPDAYERLKASIARGQFKPVLVHEDGTVLGGNMRLKAFGEMGVEDVWCIVVSAPTEEEKIDYALRDNDRAGIYIREKLIGLSQEFPSLDLDRYSVDMGVNMSLAAVIAEGMPVEMTTDVSDRDALKEKFDNATIKQITLYFGLEEYEDVLSRLQVVMDARGLGSHTEAVLHILETYENAGA